MIEKILNIKKTIYSSKLNEPDLKNKIKDIFEQKTLKFVGKFTSQNEFAASDKWTYITWYVPNVKRKMAYLKGKIIKSEKGTFIELNIKPNPVISIFPVLSILIGIITIIAVKSNKENPDFFIIGLIIIAVGILFYLFGLFIRNRLRNNFRNHFDLQKL